MKNRIIISGNNNAYFNLAAEEYLFESIKSGRVFYIYINDKSVILGNFQNAWSECDIGALKKDGVALVRRKSGGGAVYHDLGNVNFSFISAETDFNRGENYNVIINALKAFSIDAEKSGRNDMTANGKKFSGNAFKSEGGKNLHHGTVLVSLETKNAEKYLTPAKGKLLSKGVKSVRSRIVNLNTISKDITCENLISGLIKNYKNAFGAAEINNFTSKEISEINKTAEKLMDTEYVLNTNPACAFIKTAALSIGNAEFFIEVKENKIKNIKIYSDCLDFEIFQKITDKLTGVKYVKADISAALGFLEEGLKEEVLKAIEN